jgi:anti-sigma regulatory factor (Ser/Thr protein kinase)
MGEMPPGLGVVLVGRHDVPVHQVSHLLAPEASSIVLARRAVDALSLTAARTGDVKLIVSELVTNSVEHADLAASDRIEVLVTVDPRGALHVEVRDPGPGPPPDARSGMGWRILERVADRWGVEHREGKARVWIELDPA